MLSTSSDNLCQLNMHSLHSGCQSAPISSCCPLLDSSLAFFTLPGVSLLAYRNTFQPGQPPEAQGNCLLLSGTSRSIKSIDVLSYLGRGKMDNIFYFLIHLG